MEFGEEVEKVKKFVDYLFDVVSTSAEDLFGLLLMDEYREYFVVINDLFWSNVCVCEFVEMMSLVLG